MGRYERNTPKNYGGSYKAPPPENLSGSEQPRKFVLKEKVKEMLKYGLPLLDGFPRRNRRMADEMRQSALTLLRLATRLEKRIYKKTTLDDMDIELSTLRDFIELASDRDYYGTKYAPPISLHQREVWARHNTEIGKLIGGYKKFVESSSKK